MKPFFIVILLFFSLNTTLSSAQLIEPTNNCSKKFSNSEADPCNSEIKSTYNPCLCNYYKELREYRRKSQEYTKKQAQISNQIRSITNVNVSGTKYSLEQVSKEEGFDEKKRTVLNELELQRKIYYQKLNLSYEKEKYCVRRGCADSDINIWKTAMRENNKEIAAIKSATPKQSYSLSLNTTSNNKTSSNSNKKRKTKEKKETYNTDRYIRERERKTQARNDYQRALNRGDYRGASKIMDQNKDAFSNKELTSAYIQETGRAIGKLISYIPEAEMGYATLNYSLDQYTWGLFADYNFIYPVEGFTGLGYNFGFGISWDNKEYKSNFKRDNSINGQHLDFTAGITIGNPERFLILNTISVKAHYRYYSSIFYNSNMTQAFNTDGSRKDFYDGELTKGGRFSVAFDTTFFKYLKAGIIINGKSNIKDLDDNTSFNTLNGEEINYNSIFTDKYSFYFGIVIAIR